jgi:hypothetical protein
LGLSRAEPLNSSPASDKVPVMTYQTSARACHFAPHDVLRTVGRAGRRVMR